MDERYHIINIATILSNHDVEHEHSYHTAASNACYYLPEGTATSSEIFSVALEYIRGMVICGTIDGG